MTPVKTFIVALVQHARSNQFRNDPDTMDTRKFYKICYVHAGSIIISINGRHLVLCAGNIIFLRPGDQLSIEQLNNANAYLCLVQSVYLSSHSGYLADLFSHFPLRLFYRKTIKLNSKQSSIVKLSFDMMLLEQKGKNYDQKHATAIHLQMIMLQIQRAAREAGYPADIKTDLQASSSIADNLQLSEMLQ